MSVTVLVLAGVVFLGVWLVLSSRHDHKLREKILKHGERIDDGEYIARMPFLSDEQEGNVALRLRTVFAGIAKLPRECITPELLVDDVFRAQCFILYDGVDLAELVMELEDDFDIEIPEDSCGLQFSEGDTVAVLTYTFVNYARFRGLIEAKATD